MQIFFDGATSFSQSGFVVEEYTMNNGIKCFNGYLDFSPDYQQYSTTDDIFDAKIFPNKDKALEAISTQNHLYPYDVLKHKVVKVDMVFEKAWED